MAVVLVIFGLSCLIAISMLVKSLNHFKTFEVNEDGILFENGTQFETIAFSQIERVQILHQQRTAILYSLSNEKWMRKRVILKNKMKLQELKTVLQNYAVHLEDRPGWWG